MRTIVAFLFIMGCNHMCQAAEKKREIIDLTGDEPVTMLVDESELKRTKVSPAKEVSPTRSILKRSPSPKKKGNVTFDESAKKHQLTLAEVMIIEGEKVSLQQIRDYQTDEELLTRLYVDAGQEGISVICGSTRQEALAHARSKKDAQ